MKIFLLLVAAVLLVTVLSACNPLPPPVISPTNKLPSSPTASPFPTPAASFSGDPLEERLALRNQFSPQAGVVANNRVEALICTHDFVETYTQALKDDFIDEDELSQVIQLAANARASLFSTGHLDMIEFANTLGWLVNLAIYGDWEIADQAIQQFQRSLPRKPSLN